MKSNVGKRMWALLLSACLLLGLIPVWMPVEAEAVSGVDSLTCAGFISNPVRQNYIDVMMKYYINNNSSLQSTLNSGKSVVFMFEGGSDNYDKYAYVDAAGSTRLQAVCIVVQLDSSGKAAIVFNSENCSSLPDDANWSTPGYETSGSTTILDGIYSFQTVNHNGNYAGFNTSCYKGWYIPYSGSTGYKYACEGINIHTRSVSYCGGSSYGWCNSAGCQVIGYGASSSNEYNTFVKRVAGISFNAYDGTQRTYSSGVWVNKGYYVVDRQLGLMNPSGTDYGSGSLIELYGKADLAGITEFSTSARANAKFGYTSECTIYPSYCQFKTTQNTQINSQPCASGSNDSKTLQSVSSGATYTSTGLYKNPEGKLWYQVSLSNGTTGYINGAHTSYIKDLTSDITISDCQTPNGHVAGNKYSVTGNVASKYNCIETVATWIHSGFGTSGITVAGYQDTVNGKAYNLLNSNVDFNTTFNVIGVGNYTYAISVTYINYYAKGGTSTVSNTGTKYLCAEYFVVIPSSVSQSSCNHSYTTTVLEAATCTESGVSVKSCGTCGYVTQTNVAASGHQYTDWYTVNPTCDTDGSRSRTCKVCSNVEKQLLAAKGHSYSVLVRGATCNQYAIYEYTCSSCGDYYKLNAGELTSQWIAEVPLGMNASDFRTTTQYRYSDYQTQTSTSSSLSGYTLKGTDWVKASSGSVKYVESWPTGFSSSSSLYSTYNKQSNKVAVSETENAKTEVNSDAVCGYLYYHWCYSSSNYSQATSSGDYTTFHAYYSTTSPDSYTCDTSDNSYKTSHSGCSNSGWYFVTEVYEQKYTNYNKQYVFERWTEFSSWSNTQAIASATRKVETRTAYQLKSASLGTHIWRDGVCSSCGKGCSHAWSNGRCTTCGYGCTHNWVNGACASCYVKCTHNWSNEICSQCGMKCSHSYSDGICTVCGHKEAVTEYYLFGFINGSDYACEGDYANLGEYRFVNGKLVAFFATDSYVGVKTGDNSKWFMTTGWLGTDVSTATLYETGTLGNADKLFVPGGVQVTFNLTQNADGTLTLSYMTVKPSTTLPTVTLKSPALTFKDEVLINAFFTVSDWTNVKECGMITYSSKVSVWNVDNAENVIPGCVYDSSKGYYYATSSGIEAKRLGDTVYLSVYCKMVDGTYVYSKLASYSPKTYAYNQLKTSSDAKVKALMVAMLNYGAAAQSYFNYNTGALVNKDLTTTQKTLATQYRSSMVAAVGTVDSGKVGIFTNSGGFSKRVPAITFGSAFSINYFFVPSNTPSGGLKLYYWNQSDYDAATTLTPSNSTGSIKLTLINGQYQGEISGISAKDLDKTIYVAAGYNSNGRSYCSGVLPYSIGAYCVSQAAKGGDVQSLAEATAVYGYYAKQYFENA